MPQTKKNAKENFKKMSGGELEKKLTSLRENIRVIKFKAEGSRSKNVKELSVLRKDIARVLTEKNHAGGRAGSIKK